MNGCRFSSFAKNLGKNIGKSVNKIVSGKYSQNFFDHAKQSGPDAFKTTLKSVIQKTTETTGDLIRNEITDMVAKSNDDKITSTA